jgi:hypothetical protein
VSAAAFTAVTLAYIARYDLGFSREEIRTFAVVAAPVAVALVVLEFFGKKLRLKRRARGQLGRFLFLFTESTGARPGPDDFALELPMESSR